jgi:hypothetical protein
MGMTALSVVNVGKNGPPYSGFVTGHDFSRADKAHGVDWALAPEKCVYGL